MPLKLKFSHKWLEGRHASLDPENVQEEYTPSEKTTMLETVDTVVGTIPGSSSTSIIIDQRLLKLLFDEIAANERQIKDLKACKNKLFAIN